MKRIKQYICLLLAAALCLTACSSTTGSEGTTAAATQEATTAETTAADTGNGLFTAGTYTGTAQGYGGEVTVTITVDASSITDVKVEGADETPEVGGAALDTLAESIKTAGSAEIDGVAGATITSDAVKTAAADALAQAQG